MAKVTQLSPGLWQISLPFLGEHEIIGSYLLAGENELAILDPGPSSTLDALLDSIRDAGFDPQNVTHILATHVHLDHAGAAGSLVHQLPKAQVYVHSNGAPHLIDMSKVVASAERIYGERMQMLWGNIESVPAERIYALEGGDNVIAIIRGSAINNDGGLKVSFTAPGIDGQFEAISEALAIAGVRPESITYVEAHGTGTALGDPAEIAALTKAFGPNSKIKQWCAIGSVKSNMGHLDVAAGVAGLMKTALQLQHAQIVPTLHFEAPNPKIDFPKTPFYVSTKLREWNGDLGPRRAGVSSFGMGGTNAHVILEEALPTMPSEAARGWEVLVVSAKTAAALERAAAEFANYLRNTTAPLADIAWTTHVGRATFPHRRAVVCQNTDSGARLLEKGDRSAVCNGIVSSTRPVAFLFPGQGSQYLGMGRDLYEAEPTFRAEVDGFSELFRPHLDGRRLQDILYPTPDRALEAEHELTQTAIARTPSPTPTPTFTPTPTPRTSSIGSWRGTAGTGGTTARRWTWSLCTSTR